MHFCMPAFFIWLRLRRANWKATDGHRSARIRKVCSTAFRSLRWNRSWTKLRVPVKTGTTNDRSGGSRHRQFAYRTPDYLSSKPVANSCIPWRRKTLKRSSRLLRRGKMKALEHLPKNYRGEESQHSNKTLSSLGRILFCTPDANRCRNWITVTS